MEILQEEQLRALSRDFTSILAEKPESTDKIPSSPDVLLERIFFTAEEPHLSASHRAAVCNALCGFLLQGSRSSSVALRNLCSSSHIWKRTFCMFLEQYQNAQAKPMKHVLMYLLKSIKQTVECKELSAFAVLNSLSYIISDHDPLLAKPAVLAIEGFLSKKLLSPAQLVTLSSLLGTDQSELKIQSAMDNPATINVAKIEKFVLPLLQWIENVELAPVLGRLVTTFFSQVSKDIIEIPLDTPVWAESIRKATQGDRVVVEAIEHYVLPDLFGISLDDTTSFLQGLPLHTLFDEAIEPPSEEDLRLCLLVIKTLFTKNVNFDLSPALSIGRGASEPISARTLVTPLISHASGDIRVTAVSIILHSPSTATRIPSSTFMALRKCIPSFHTETDARLRTDFLSIMRRFCLHVSSVISRTHLPETSNSKASDMDSSSTSDSAANTTSLDQAHRPYANFARWWASFLLEELQPTASYQRHITALKILGYFQSCGMMESVLGKFEQETLLRLLVDLLLDPFDDVRAVSAAILQRVPVLSQAEFASVTSHGVVSISAITRAEDLMRNTGRADYADGFGRFHEILYSRISEDAAHQKRYVEGVLSALENDIEAARTDLQRAIKTAPIHGRCITLSYIFGRPDTRRMFIGTALEKAAQWRTTTDRIISCCTQIWDIVKPILCVDSPEGKEFSPNEENLDIGIKDTLSFSWRALKEASTLLHACLDNSTYGHSDFKNDLEISDIERIGQLSFVQLAELRHRGAFSTVSRTFNASCAFCAKSKDVATRSLPQSWYANTLACIQEKASALTRRSAGLPAMITGILAADTSKSFFAMVVTDLLTTAQGTDYERDASGTLLLPQVHSLNCLKDIFTNTQLGPASEAHLVPSFIVAIGCLENEIWAIRNCGLMLLKALLTRLNGGSGKMAAQPRPSTSRSVFLRYPKLSDLVVDLLKRGVSSGNVGQDSLRSQFAFSSIEILESTGLPPRQKIEVQQLLFEYLDSPVWAIRDKSARLLSATLSLDELTIAFHEAVHSPILAQNALYGCLLSLHYALGARISRLDQDALREFETRYHPTRFEEVGFVVLSTIFSTQSFLLSAHCSPFVRALYLKVALLAARIWSMAQVKADREKILKYMEDLRANLDQQWNLHLTADLDAPDVLVEVIISARLTLSFLSIGTNVSLVEISHDARCLSAALGTYREYTEKVDPTALATIVLRSSDHGVATVAINALVEVFDRSGYMGNNGEAVLDRKLVSGLLDWTGSCETGNPEHSNALLQLQGLLIALEISADGQFSPSAAGVIPSWIMSVHDWSHESNEFPTRLAAAKSLLAFYRALKYSHNFSHTTPNLMPVLVAVYEILRDDDDEIREIGASVVFFILSTCKNGDSKLSTTRFPCTPAAAASQLIEFMANTKHNSTKLLEYSVRSIFDDEARWLEIFTSVGIGRGRHVHEVAMTLDTAMEEDNSLFVKEKQNLYIDLVQELETWAWITDQLDLVNCYPDYVEALCKSVVEGIEALSRTTQRKRDGPLGWTSKPEVYKLGMQFIIAADILVKWENRRTQHQLTIRPALRRLLDAAETGNLHELWITRIRRIKGVVGSDDGTPI